MPASLRRPRRVPGLRGAVAVLVPALLVPALAACGSSKAGYGDPTSSGFDAATVTGAVGKEPTLKWNSQLAYPTSTQTKTLVPGTGGALSADRSLDLRIYIADPNDDLQNAQQSCRATVGSSASSSASAGASKAAATDVPSVAPSATDSASATASPLTMSPCPSNVSFPIDGDWVYATAAGQYDAITPSQAGTVWQTILNGAKAGSRIEAISTSEDVFPPQQQGYPAGNPQLGIANHDALLMVVDVVRATPAPPKPKTVSPSALPKVELKNGKPSGFDWTGIKKPSAKGPLERAVLKQGTGAVVKSTDTVTVNYLGEVYKAKKYFDESYFPKSKGAKAQPLTSALSGLVKGWQSGLTGVKVGSRVVLQIPPSLGYGSQAQSGIPANSTLWFVVDVLKTTSGS